jgi:hypothetical protein
VNDAIRLPNGKTVTRSRASARGWIDADGNLTAAAPKPSREQAIIDKAQRAKDWRRTQRLDSPEEQAALTGTPAPKVPKPLKPQNVTPDGEPITDKALLAEIATKTAAIERKAQS